MAIGNNTPSPVLPLPPLEYDVQYMNSLIRVLTYYIEQQDNPGQIRGTSLALSDGNDTDQDVVIDTRASSDITRFVILELPISAVGLETGQIWNNAGVLNIIP
jgi:hypothetical protein